LAGYRIYRHRGGSASSADGNGERLTGGGSSEQTKRCP